MTLNEKEKIKKLLRKESLDESDRSSLIYLLGNLYQEVLDNYRLMSAILEEIDDNPERELHLDIMNATTKKYERKLLKNMHIRNTIIIFSAKRGSNLFGGQRRIY